MERRPAGTPGPRPRALEECIELGARRGETTFTTYVRVVGARLHALTDDTKAAGRRLRELEAMADRADYFAVARTAPVLARLAVRERRLDPADVACRRAGAHRAPSYLKAAASSVGNPAQLAASP
jgi:hypothetical protein